MSNFKPVLSAQYQLMQSKAKLTIAACEPGAGVTYGLAIKAIHEARDNNKFVLMISTFPDRAGACNEIFKHLLDEEQYRYSQASCIYTFPNGGRVKLVHYGHKQAWVGCSFDVVLCDHRFEFLDHSTMFRTNQIVVSAYPDVVMNHEWFHDFFDGGTFEDFVEVVKFKAEDNFFMKDNIYFEYARKSIPEHFGFKF